ncbi:GNAT family N-acetyltransferase [Swingsia samuiensis]|uniref:N-acetyltransferase n=1 Tax=Swingsia samuiensis TaxID=1293412 RepID=A0A4Y6UKB6_9PROT|nr:GNAT family N-acetyltransferase [Swingsia samuiensis]QDH17088.1 N-acetyltransferase [Swingsia samuiensis]
MLGRGIRTTRLSLKPVEWQDLEDMIALKTNAGAFGRMLGGVRSRHTVEKEMAEDISFWAERKIGIFTIRENDQFVGMTGVHERPDGRGLGLRFSIFPWASGRGIAREAANAAVQYVFNTGEKRIIAVAREDNLASRIVLGGIGFHQIDTFERDGYVMYLYEIIA